MSPRGRRRRGPHARPQYVYTRPRKRQSKLAPVLALVALVVVIGAAAGWLLTRPASVSIEATPKDASIVFADSRAATGTLEADDLKPGLYVVTVSRKGYAPLTATIEAKRLRTMHATYVLEPLPNQVRITTHPQGAKCSVTCADGRVVSGVSPFSAEVPSGKITVAITMEGYNPFSTRVSLDETFTADYFLDPKGQLLHCIGTITTLGAPKGVSVTHDGSEAWTSILNGPPSIEIFNPRTGRKIGEVDIGKYGAVEVIFNRAGTLAYTSQMETAKCFEIDVKTRKVLREFKTESAWTKWVTLSPDEKTLYASNWSGDDVSVIDLTTGKLLRRIGVSNTPRGMYATADGKTLYVGGFDSGELDRIDLATGTRTTAFADGGALRHLVGDEKTGRLFISDMAKDVIWVHDMKTGKTSKFADVDEKPNTIDLTPDGRVLFVSCRGENNSKSYYIPGPEWGSILVFDTASGRPLDAIIAGNQPTALDVSDDG
ncbi:MAG: PEGA domain-containing protein, partial [Coriobacteriales bacterium]